MSNNIEFMDFLVQIAKEMNDIEKSKKSQRTEDDFSALKNESSRLYLEHQQALDDQVATAKSEGKIEEILENEDSTSDRALITSDPGKICLPSKKEETFSGTGFKLI